MMGLISKLRDMITRDKEETWSPPRDLQEVKARLIKIEERLDYLRSNADLVGRSKTEGPDAQ